MENVNVAEFGSTEKTTGNYSYKLSSPMPFLWTMVLFLIIVGFIAAILFRQAQTAFMNGLTGEKRVDASRLRTQIEARDREFANPFAKDAQVAAIRGARRYLGDRLMRTARPHALLDPRAGPLIAVRLHILTRKSLGGLETDLSARVIGHGKSDSRHSTIRIEVSS